MKHSGSWILPVILLASCTIKFTGDFNKASEPQRPAASLPERTFEAFWQTFEDHYAFFSLHGVDWQNSYNQFRPQVGAFTADDSLFAILSAMVKPLQDDHVTIIYPNKKSYQEFTAAKPSHFLQEFPDESAQKNFWKMVDQTLREHGFSELVAAGPKEDGVPLFYYGKSKNVGYVRFTRCYVTSKTENDADKDAVLAGSFFDGIIEALNNSEEIIIDVRVNEGGNDEFAYAIANRFTNKKTVGHYQQYRTGGYEDFSPLVAVHLEPQGKLFLKPATVLTNDQTASAADVFALIMKALPQTTLVGENSTGIYSDMYGFKLPNGWYASLSNERYYSSTLKCYEGTGTPVDVLVRNDRHNLASMRDPVLIKALEK